MEVVRQVRPKPDLFLNAAHPPAVDRIVFVFLPYLMDANILLKNSF